MTSRISKISLEKPGWDRLREIHRSIRKRTEFKDNKDYPHYGGRGIKMCKEWQDFEVFYEWAITHGYDDTKTIDRISNNRGYNPGNCRWISRMAQAHNRTTNRILRASSGEAHDMKTWERITGLSSSMICKRLKRGWTVDEALFTPSGCKRKKK